MYRKAKKWSMAMSVVGLTAVLAGFVTCLRSEEGPVAAIEKLGGTVNRDGDEKTVIAVKLYKAKDIDLANLRTFKNLQIRDYPSGGFT
ncbi:MAG: hypothetical protein FJ271_25345 [Planctomycetes bacterium]|nr:hypothetical protein [Planctomycetota bacterium]